MILVYSENYNYYKEKYELFMFKKFCIISYIIIRKLFFNGVFGVNMF